MENLNILFAKANYLHSNYIGNEGELSYPDKQYGYLCDEIEDVEVGYYKDESVDSSYADRLRSQGFSLTEEEARDILSHRIEEIEDYYKEIGAPLVYNLDFEAKTDINTEIELAKQVLKNNGYFVENLWHVEDVKSKYECTDEQAQTVLNDVLTSEWFKGEINASIDITADAYSLPKKASKYFLVSGFWKDDKVKFENYIIKEFDDVDENEDTKIFFYGLNASDIEELIIEKWNSEHEFVITSYEETTLN